jgi:hypothetical protein
LLLNTVGILSKINVNFFTEFLTMRWRHLQATTT